MASTDPSFPEALCLPDQIIAALGAAVDVETNVISTPHALTSLISSLRGLVVSRSEPEEEPQQEERAQGQAQEQ